MLAVQIYLLRVVARLLRCLPRRAFFFDGYISTRDLTTPDAPRAARRHTRSAELASCRAPQGRFLFAVRPPVLPGPPTRPTDPDAGSAVLATTSGPAGVPGSNGPSGRPVSRRGQVDAGGGPVPEVPPPCSDVERGAAPGGVVGRARLAQGQSASAHSAHKMPARSTCSAQSSLVQ